MKNKVWAGSVLWGGVLAMVLSYATAHFTSISLYKRFHDWTGWRSIFGNSPNDATEAFSRITWALVFCSCWWMLWRLDFFLSGHSRTKPVKNDNENDAGPKYEQEEGPEEKHTNEREERTEESPKTPDPQTDEPKAEDPQPEKNLKFDALDSEEQEMAKILGLPAEMNWDFGDVKSAYRSAIAQYHPDKVSALGPEIREIAESKAKQINLAYQYFRKKLKSGK